MARPLRIDYPGAWHHISNRGVGKRTIFETRGEVRLFLSRVARVARKGLIEVHAYSILLNHFHLLVRSPLGDISSAMRLIQDGYAQRFNWRRSRRGPLFQGRFWASLIESGSYWETVLWYIDWNPVKAGMVSRPSDYEFGSARAYATCRFPPWLTTRLVTEAIKTASGTVQYVPADYAHLFGEREPSTAAANLVEQRLKPSERGRDLLDDLIRARPEEIQRMLQETARSADGTSAGSVIVNPGTVLRYLGAREIPSRTRHLLSAGMLRSLCGLSVEETAQRLDLSISTVSRRAREWKHRVAWDEALAAIAAEVLHACLRSGYRTPTVSVPFVSASSTAPSDRHAGPAKHTDRAKMSPEEGGKRGGGGRPVPAGEQERRGAPCGVGRASDENAAAPRIRRVRT